jgi:hypothetical protein
MDSRGLGYSEYFSYTSFMSTTSDIKSCAYSKSVHAAALFPYLRSWQRLLAATHNRNLDPVTRSTDGMFTSVIGEMRGKLALRVYAKMQNLMDRSGDVELSLRRLAE